MAAEEESMKKQTAFVAVLWLAAAAFGATAKLTAPKPGEPWALGTSQKIAWTWSGGAKVKLQLFSQKSGKLGIIKSGMPLGDAQCTWTVGALENGVPVPAGNGYTIRIVDMAGNTVLDTGPAFAITGPGQPPPMFKVVPFEGFIILPAGKSIQVGKPGKNAVWIPLKTYAVKWDWTVPMGYDLKCGGGGNCAGCRVDIWLMPAAGANSAQKIQLAKNKCTGYGISKGMVEYGGTCNGIVPNVSSGSYFVRVALSNNADFYGDSQTFTVQSTLSPDTGFVGPDPIQHQVDLALTDVFFDAEGNIAMKVKNLGDPYSGGLTWSYEIHTIGNNSRLLKKDQHESAFGANVREERKIVLTEWGGYQFSDDIQERGKYIPRNSRPIQVTAKIECADDINPSNNSASKKLCMIQEADIGTDGEIQLTFSPKEWLYINRGTANTIHESKIKWVSKATFEVELEIDLWNYGCSAKTFDLWLYADKLPGQLLQGGIFLPPGYKTTLKQPVQVKLPSQCGDHQLVFIADPKEHDNEPYPNSYMNNFIDVTLRILCGGTAQGSGL
jgi:hypothetical protein